MDGHVKRGKLLHFGVVGLLVFGLSVAADDAFAAQTPTNRITATSNLVGGPDGFGYYFVDDAEVILSFNFLDASGGTATVSGDEGVAVVNLNQPFTFYGNAVNQIAMSTNGYLSTSAADPGTDNTNDCPIPAPAQGARMYPLHDNLVTGQGYMEYFATCPRTNELGIDGQAEGCTVFQWDDTNHFGSTATFNPFRLQTILYHTSGVILHQIEGDPAGGALSTTGIQDAAGTTGLMYACNTAGSVQGNTAVAFYLCGAITVSPATLPNGTLGTAYSQQVTASGGTPAYTYGVTGQLPPGLTLNTATGLISGTPTQVGTFNFTITATDAKGCVGSQAYVINILGDNCPGVTISPANVPGGTVGSPYSVTFTATGGQTPPFTFALTGGALPPGLNLSAGGVLSGTPTITGEFNFTITATDSDPLACTGTASYCLVIFPTFNLVGGHGLGQDPANTNRVEYFDVTGAPVNVAFEAYGAGQWGTNVSSGNASLGEAVNSQEAAEVYTGPGPGAVYGPHIRGFKDDGSPINKVNFFAYSTLKYGANVAAGNLETGATETCSALDELLTGAGPGAVFGPHVRAWNYDGIQLTTINKVNFFAYSTLKWGVNVEEGDVELDGFSEILTGPGPGIVFGPQVKGFNFDGNPVQAIAKINFTAFTVAEYGVNISGGDVDGDGWAEIAATPGPGATLITEHNGWDYDGGPISALNGYSVMPWGATQLYGGRLGLGDIDADGAWDLLAGRGRDPAGDSELVGYTYDGSGLNETFRTVLFPGTVYGVNSAGARLGY